MNERTKTKLARLEAAIEVIVARDTEPISPAGLIQRVQKFYDDWAAGRIPETPVNLARRRSLDSLIELARLWRDNGKS